MAWVSDMGADFTPDGSQYQLFSILVKDCLAAIFRPTTQNETRDKGRDRQPLQIERRFQLLANMPTAKSRQRILFRFVRWVIGGKRLSKESGD